MMKKAAAILLAVILAASAFAGCANTDTPGGIAESYNIPQHNGVENAGDGNPTLAAAMNGKKYDLTPNWLCEEKTTLTILTYDAVNSNYLPPSNDLWFWQTLEEYTNVHIEWEVSPNAGYGEVLNTRLSAGVDLADIIMSTNTIATTNAGNNGIFIDLMPYWDTCFTNTKTYFDNIGTDLLTYITNPNGKVYALPNIMNPTEGHITFLYNTQWLEELGAEVPTTLDAFTELLYQMQQAGDLNHNGMDDEVILTSSTMTILMSVLGNAFNLEIYEGWDAFDADAKGNVISEYTSENMRACLSYMNQLYEDGILDSEINYMSDDSLGEKIANDRVGCFVFYSGFSIAYGNLTSAGQDDPLGEHYTLGMPLASEWNNNEGYFVQRTLAYGNTGASITAECENPELAAKWLDVLYADPNIMWIRCYGKEGETFQFNGQTGNLELICNADGSWSTRHLGIGQISLPFIQTTEELLSDKLVYPWYLEQYERIRNCKWISASVPKVSIFSEEEAALRSEVNSEVSAYWFEWRDKLVTGLVNIDTDWNTYVSSINGVGMTQLTQVWQMVYDRLKQ